VVREKDGEPVTRAEYNAQFGEPVPESPDWPEALDYLWDAFWDVSTDRQEGMNGPLPLGSVLIHAWSEANGEPLNHDEVRIIRAMDRAYLVALSEEMAEAWRPKSNKA